MTTPVLRAHAEQQFAEELAALDMEEAASRVERIVERLKAA